MTGDFIPGSSAIGILIVVYSVDNEFNSTMIKYHFVHHSNIRRTITMTNLPNGQYEVSIFVVEGNGLPFSRSATTPKNVSLIERKLYRIAAWKYLWKLNLAVEPKITIARILADLN